MEEFFALAGLSLAAYSVVGNDSIQTLGTFLVSNEKKPWWLLAVYAGTIMAVVVTMGYLGLGEYLGGRGGDLTFGKFAKTFPNPADYPTITIWYLAPPLTLLFITRFGIPVSTTFLVLTFFAPKALPSMLLKSLGGYGVAFGFAICSYFALSRLTERYFMQNPLGKGSGLMQSRSFWTSAQWLATAFLWSQWLTQDLVNIMVYLGDPKDVAVWKFIFALVMLVGMLAFIFWQRGGKIQEIVRVKTNTADIRSATFIDLFYGLVLLVFKFDTFGVFEGGVPMSTTWVFLGMLGGREVALRMRLEGLDRSKVWPMVFSDLGKATIGLVISVLLVIALYMIEGRDLSSLFG